MVLIAKEYLIVTKDLNILESWKEYFLEQGCTIIQLVALTTIYQQPLEKLKKIAPKKLLLLSVALSMSIKNLLKQSLMLKKKKQLIVEQKINYKHQNNK